MSAASLIAAIQTTDPAVLRAEVERLMAEHHQAKRRSPSKTVPNPLDDTLGALELTALHVAAKAYAVHRANPTLARAFDEMVQILLDEGANPALEIGVKRERRWLMGRYVMMEVAPGQTVAEVCERHLPPSLTYHFETYVGGRNQNIGTLWGSKNRECLSAAMKEHWRKRKAEEKMGRSESATA